jgi:hypothetical protein
VALFFEAELICMLRDHTQRALVLRRSPSYNLDPDYSGAAGEHVHGKSTSSTAGQTSTRLLLPTRAKRDECRGLTPRALARTSAMFSKKRRSVFVLRGRSRPCDFYRYNPQILVSHDCVFPIKSILPISELQYFSFLYQPHPSPLTCQCCERCKSDHNQIELLY